MASITDSVARILILNSGFSLDFDRGMGVGVFPFINIF
jgi:hypothetical protein